MTNKEAIDAYDIASAIPLDIRPGASYLPTLILIRGGLCRVIRDLEPVRQSIISDALVAAKAPEDFISRIGNEEKDEETDRIMAQVNSFFIPAWSEVLKETSSFRYKLLSPAQYIELHEALTVPEAPSSYSIGGRDDIDPITLSVYIAETLVEPD